MSRVPMYGLLLLAFSGQARTLPGQQSPPAYRNGDPLTITGRLDVVYRGWSGFLILRTGKHLADFGPGTPPQPVAALELRAPGQFRLLAEHLGEPVQAAGTLELDNVSPYYWNGVALLAQTVTLPGGIVLQSERVMPHVPAGTDFYTVTVAMVPHQLEWRREARDLTTGDLLPDPNLDGCSLNGGGDVMNCLCTQGFAPIRAGVVPHPLPANGWRAIPAATYALPGMAQFVLPDADATHPQIVQVACKRTSSPAKGSNRR